MSKKYVELKKQPYQSPDAYIYTDKVQIAPLEYFTIYGRNFTSFKKRGNPGVAIMLDDKPLTGVKVGCFDKFSIRLRMPPFTPGKHTLDAFGVTCEIEILEATDVIIDQKKMKELIDRDFILAKDCDIHLSDVRYKVCPIAVLKAYLENDEVKKKKYIAEWFDCDDFSDALHGRFTFDSYPYGFAHGELWVDTGQYGHAIDCFLVHIPEENITKLVVVEPQNGTIFDFPKEWKAFMIKI